MISIVDYGMGNSGSIINMLRRIGAESRRAATPAEIETAERLILPGVGAFDNGMQRLGALGMLPALRARVAAGTPILGICLGMQLFAEASDEGGERGLGWIRGRVRRLEPRAPADRLPIPHMGWATVELRRQSPLFAELPAGPRFYFAHSYHVDCADPADVLAVADYGGEFVAAVARGPVVGVQFHPEKSLRWGMHLMERFAAQEAVGSEVV